MLIANRGLARRLSLIGASPVVLVSVFCLVGWAQEATPPKLGELNDKLAPFVPSPMPVVEEMLKLAEVNKDDKVYDLGSGDGRIVIMAAQKFGAKAVGVELDAKLFQESTARIAELGLERRARILHENMYSVSLRPATVVTLYLLTSVNERLKPILERDLRPGARVVTHDFRIPGWEPKATREVISGNGISHTVYLYVRP
jgi:SAM-dependent methyltransferase